MAAIIDQTRPDHPIVSFCIPVYNNAKAAETIVKSLLSSDDSRFEVVVSDDNSQENVEELLSRIHDSRFRYYRNAKNLGAHKNWEHTLELGRGDWLYLIIARDMVHGEHIPHLIELLDYARKNNIPYLKDGYYMYMAEATRDVEIYSGIKAMEKFTMPEHPTADIYDGEMFRTMPGRTRYFEISDMYPENYVRHYLLLKGRGAYIMSGVHIYLEPRLIDYFKVRSGVDKSKNVFDSFFAPRRRNIHYSEVIDMIDADCPGVFKKKEINSYFDVAFEKLIFEVTSKWRQYCQSLSWMTHYGHEVRHVSSIEMLGNVFTARRLMKEHLKEKGTYTFSRELIMCSRVAKVSIGMCYTVAKRIIKACAKKILEPIGIWTLLKGLKRLIKG